MKRYLEAAGQAGEFYREALELLDEAEQKLPEPMCVDRYLLQAEQLIARKDYEGCSSLAMNKIVALQREAQSHVAGRVPFSSMRG